jgi:predicted XRE-type DNA-binding protein
VQPFVPASGNVAAETSADRETVDPTAAPTAEHDALVQQLERHMVANNVSQQQVASAVKLSSGGKLSMWLGRSADTLNPEMRAETDALIAAYLDRFAAHSPRALGSAQTSAAALASAGCAASTAEASANSATGSSTDHATIVQRLRQHLMAHGMRQVDVAARAGISSSKLSMWMSAKSKMYFTPGGATEEGSDCARED